MFTFRESFRGREIPMPEDRLNNVGRSCTVGSDPRVWVIVRTLPETVGEPRYGLHDPQTDDERSANLGQLYNLV
jgi:hypothetical protein